MLRHGGSRRVVLAAVLGIFPALLPPGTSRADLSAVAPGLDFAKDLGELEPGATYRLLVSLRSGKLSPADSVRVELTSPGEEPTSKTLHAGDPDLYLTYRPADGGPARVVIRAAEGSSEIPVLVEWSRLDLPDDQAPAIEAEPNDDWRRANPLVLGRDVYGSADDVDYLENPEEGRSGLDWFRFEVDSETPVLAYFQLDLLDRDISANLRVYRVGDDGVPAAYQAGKDPMEIVHDRERERYSKHISRTFTKGTYYFEVNANHPAYVLRTRVLPVPPYDDPSQAVEAGMHYIMNVGDAWFAQIPREGNIFARSDNLHDTATRCTACHPAIFSTEANLTAHRFGYPIRSKDDFQYVIDRLYNSVTPLYGPDGLYWQRYIAIPLQSQGKGCGVLMDFERQVSGVETPTFRRFAPFLRAAWGDRTELPADEVNGVVPLDSKFGIAWRDHRVLREAGRRGEDPADLRAADNLARLVADPASSKKVETFQDRIHRLYARHSIGVDPDPRPLRQDAEALFDLQNEDGGWHEVDSKRGPSAVYTTGQVVWTLLEIGYPRDDPRIAKALRYLLAQQKEFGGWFQTDSHENFRTPMRETRFAVMALAEGFPKGAPLNSWGNRDEGPARLPRSDGLVPLLDDLENLWDVPEAERPRFAAAIIPLLDHPEPLVRAHAAACLGRLGREEAVHPLIGRLDDPSKIVWRAAAWALRRLGNAGVGVEAILGALRSTDPLTRRGAARIFAYQFHGMDERREIALQLLQLTDDPDLWTRLQALKTLRQWFYRSGDPAFQRRIVFAYLSRMSTEDVPVVRKNLSQGLYIMLDENLGGGVSLHKNIAQLPESMRPGILAARAEVERGVLLTPLLSALETGDIRQREAILQAFDGSFFKGRFYARRPTNMIDVGNDREFGFLYEPPASVLDRVFAALLDASLPAESRRQAIALARFFVVPGRTEDPAVRAALLKALADPDADVRRAAQEAVGELTLRGIAEEPALLAQVVSLVKGPPEAAIPTIRAVARVPDLATQPDVREALRSLLDREDAAMLLASALSSPVFSDAEALDVLSRGWGRAKEPADRLALLEALLARRSLIDVEDPRAEVRELLRAAIHDPSASVREKTLEAVGGLVRFRAGRVSAGLLLSALADDLPSIRRLGLQLASAKAGFWTRPDAREALLRLLVDADPKVRESALGVVEAHRLLADSPETARRVKALVEDRSLVARARAAMQAQGFDPERIEADVRLSRSRLLSPSLFRRRVNPLFYEAGDDGYSCARCHANHAILRVAEADSAKGFTDEQVTVNYNSALKVINLGDPESSLILRKPRSPQGQGEADPTSPTGLTHVGGPRWEGTDHPGYRAILDWLREARADSPSTSEASRLSADSYAPDFPPALAGDGDLDTIWQTEFVGGSPGYPHELVVDLGESRETEGLLYVPRQDASEGRVKAFEVSLSQDGRSWTEPVARGTWDDDPSYKVVGWTPTAARYVKLRGLSELGGGPSMSAAELVIDASPPGRADSRPAKPSPGP
jgi:HEAT repeat protein